MKKIFFSPFFPAFFLVSIISNLNLNCTLFDLLTPVDDGSGPMPHELCIKDSIAVKGILNDNELNMVNVHSIISFWENSNYISEINLSSLSLKKFVFSKYFDSLTIPLSYLQMQNNQIDTLIINDTINLRSQNSYFTICLQHNNLRIIPDGIKKIKSILELYLDHNQINFLSDSIMHCNIGEINVNYNNLCNISDSIAQWITRKGRDSTWRNTQNCH